MTPSCSSCTPAPSPPPFPSPPLPQDDPELLLQLLLSASQALGPVIRRFISLGLNRVWLKSGDTPYRQGDPAECL